MTSKPYGKFTSDQIKTFSIQLQEAQPLGDSLQSLMKEAGPEKLKEILGKNFAWYSLYEQPFEVHIAIAVMVLGWQDEIHAAALADDPQQAFLDFTASLDQDADWQGEYQGIYEKKDLTAIVISVFKTMKSIMVYQKSLSRLIEEVRLGNDKSLFDAVRIDRSVLACPSIASRISLAELQGEQKFFLHLKKALRGPSRKHMIALDALRFMMTALVDTGADRLSSENLEQLFVDTLKLYSPTPGAQKNLRKHYDYTKKINHRK